MWSGTILDLGCGSGILSYLLKNEGFDIHGIDTWDHSEMIEVFKHDESLQASIWADIDKNLTFYNGKSIHFEDRYFDAVVMHAVYEHLSDKEAMIKEIHRVLKPNGRIFIFRTPHKNAWQEKITKAHSNLIEEERLYMELERTGFRITEKSKTDFMFWSVPEFMQGVWNFMFPMLNFIDKAMLKTRFVKYAHNLKVVARKGC